MGVPGHDNKPGYHRSETTCDRCACRGGGLRCAAKRLTRPLLDIQMRRFSTEVRRGWHHRKALRPLRQGGRSLRMVLPQQVAAEAAGGAGRTSCQAGHRGRERQANDDAEADAEASAGRGAADDGKAGWAEVPLPEGE